MTGNATKTREHIVWTPAWKREFEGYAVNYVRANQWRCDPLNQINDLLQDAYLVFHKIKTYYPRVIDPQHFMALYMRALTNTFNDKASRRQRRQGVEVHLSLDVSEFFVGRIGETTNPGYLCALVNEMPEELQLVLHQAAMGHPVDTKSPDSPINLIKQLIHEE